MIEKLVDSYLKAKNEISLAGFNKEIEWQSKISISDLTESGFLEEATWVILNSGMRESVIRNRFNSVREAFENWRSAEYIVKNRMVFEPKALSVFNHSGKIAAVFKIAEKIKKIGFLDFKYNILNSPIEFLSELPYIGPATSRHLAKNLGLNYNKPDRHLIRIANAAGFKNCDELCETLKEYTTDSISVIDIVLWRFATLNSNYLSVFAFKE